LIEKMKKVAVVCLEDDRSDAVTRLRELGSVHVADVRTPESPELDALMRQRDEAERALALLSSRKPAKSAGAAAESAPPSAAEIIRQTLEGASELSRWEERLSHWSRARTLLEPWGSFSGETVEALRQRGLRLILSSALESQLPEIPDGAVYQEISRRGKTVFFAVVAPDEIELDIPEAPLPEVTEMYKIVGHVGECEDRVRRHSQDLDALAAQRGLLADHLAQVDRDVEFHQALEGMGRTSRLCYLQGYVPARQATALAETARANGWAVHAGDPEADDRLVPTKISLPRWAEPIRPVFGFLGITPGYREVDISSCFLIFFSVFFAVIIGDAAYGAIFLMATLILRRKLPDAPAQPFRLFMLLSITTMVWGILTGTYFGIPLDRIPAPLANSRTVAYLGDPQNVQRLCFVLGAIHLTIAHLWNAAVIGKQLRALSEIGWAMVLWGNYFLALQIVLGQAPPTLFGVPAMAPLYVLGFGGVVLFSSPQRNPLKVIGAGVGALALGVVNSFVDVVSYIRLFAVGAASLKVAESFNEMAFSIGLPGLLTPFVAALILVFGHGLNIMLGALGVLVHGVRLNVLEFSGHLSMEWSGVPYKPLQE